MDRHVIERTRKAEAPPPTAGLPFETALPFLKAGYWARRRGWSGAAMHVEVVTKWSLPLKNDAWTVPFIMMEVVGGSLVPWTPTSTDLLAHDWTVLDQEGIEIVEGASSLAMGQHPLGNQ